MTQDEILRMARECGHWSGQTVEMNDVGLEQFARAIKAEVQKQDANLIQKWIKEGEAILANAGVGFQLGAWWADRPWRERK